MKNNTVDTANLLNTTTELLPKLQQHAPNHPALSRMRDKLMQNSGVQAITAYDRMHHRHNRS